MEGFLIQSCVVNLKNIVRYVEVFYRIAALWGHSTI